MSGSAASRSAFRWHLPALWTTARVEIDLAPITRLDWCIAAAVPSEDAWTTAELPVVTNVELGAGASTLWLRARPDPDAATEEFVVLLEATGDDAVRLSEWFDVPKVAMPKQAGFVVSVEILPSLLSARLERISGDTMSAAPVARSTTWPMFGSRTLRSLRVFFATTRAGSSTKRHPERFSSRFAGLRVGVSEVLLPQGLEIPEFQLASLGLKHDGSAFDVVTAEIDSRANIWGEIAEASLRTSGAPTVVVFVHGFWTSFSKAVSRTARIFARLGCEGVAIAFSWHSHDRVLGYVADTNSVREARREFLKFMRELREKVAATRVIVVTHSMGNRLLFSSIELDFENRADEDAALFRSMSHLVLAAADLDPETFLEQAPRLPAIASSSSQYVSSRDHALTLSRKVNQRERIGLCPPVFVSEHLTTIEYRRGTILDASNHAYLVEDEQVWDDLRAAVIHDRRPDKRGLERALQDKITYWRLAP